MSDRELRQSCGQIVLLALVRVGLDRPDVETSFAGNPFNLSRTSTARRQCGVGTIVVQA